MFFNVLNNGPTQPPPYQQPDYRVPSVNSAVGSYPVGGNPLNITAPVVSYTQPNPPPVTSNPALPLGQSPIRSSNAEVPSGLVSGSNTIFTLAFAPNPPASLHLCLNGLLLTPNTDFTLSGNVITFATAPPASGSLICWYSY
jgi:hypothetical protein